MPHSVFISYSRREAPFVDVLLDALEDEGLRVWLDYHSLVPGRPWLDQIFEGIRQADVFLLIVSKASMSSPAVGLEYKQALERKKRIILIIFEATNLPASLQASEWIDFRSSFRKRKKDLLTRLDEPVQQPLPPEKGFKTSLTVWLTFFVSLLILVVSIPGWWTFFLPGLLIPLPVQILRRDFDFYRVRFAILALPLVLFLSWLFFLTYPTLDTLFPIAFLVSLFLSPVFLFLLSSKGMRLWGKPRASAPRFANQYLTDGSRPQPVPFYIEHASADRKYAEAMIEGLTKYGHPHVTNPAEAKASFDRKEYALAEQQFLAFTRRLVRFRRLRMQRGYRKVPEDVLHLSGIDILLHDRRKRVLAIAGAKRTLVIRKLDHRDLRVLAAESRRALDTDGYGLRRRRLRHLRRRRRDAGAQQSLDVLEIPLERLLTFLERLDVLPHGGELVARLGARRHRGVQREQQTSEQQCHD